MKTKNIAINGFGRIGRAAFKIASKKSDIRIAGINDLMDTQTLAHLLKHDSIYGTFDADVSYDENHLVINRLKIPVFAQRDPAALPWKDLKVDVVLECTGRFTKDGAARAHLQAGAKRVIISAPAKGGGVETFLLGVNDHEYKRQEIISNASCTTNCIAPVAAVLHSEFRIIKGMMTTAHAYTAEQNIVDGPPPALHKDLRRARAAGINIVPTTTGAAKSVTNVIDGLAGVFDGMAMRVPVACGSISDFTVLVGKQITAEQVNAAFERAAVQKKYRGILQVSREPLVSSDIIGNPHSAVVDLGLTKVVGGDLVKVLAWYDNEWGYANRLVEEVKLVT